MENMKLGSIAPGTNRQLAGPEPGSWGVMLGPLINVYISQVVSQTIRGEGTMGSGFTSVESGE